MSYAETEEQVLTRYIGALEKESKEQNPDCDLSGLFQAISDAVRANIESHGMTVRFGVTGGTTGDVSDYKGWHTISIIDSQEEEE